jgi:hypothetical protein
MIYTTTRLSEQHGTAPGLAELKRFAMEITAATPLGVFLERYRRIIVCKELPRKRV